MPAKRPKRDWSIEEKIRILAKASPLTGAELSSYSKKLRTLEEDGGDGTDEEHER